MEDAKATSPKWNTVGEVSVSKKWVAERLKRNKVLFGVPPTSHSSTGLFWLCPKSSMIFYWELLQVRVKRVVREWLVFFFAHFCSLGLRVLFQHSKLNTEFVSLPALKVHKWKMAFGTPKMSFFPVLGPKCLIAWFFGVPSRELTYPTLGKGKSSSNCHFWGICWFPGGYHKWQTRCSFHSLQWFKSLLTIWHLSSGQQKTLVISLVLVGW